MLRKRHFLEKEQGVSEYECCRAAKQADRHRAAAARQRADPRQHRQAALRRHRALRRPDREAHRGQGPARQLPVGILRMQRLLGKQLGFIHHGIRDLATGPFRVP